LNRLSKNAQRQLSARQILEIAGPFFEYLDLFHSKPSILVIIGGFLGIKKPNRIASIAN
jgi:hypothetical protein